MNNKKFIFTMMLVCLLAFVVLGCSKITKSQYNAAGDFKVSVMDGGKWVEITGYVGEKSDVHIPPRIQRLPVASISEDAFREDKVTSVIIPNLVGICPSKM
jgi:hypothetical protein